MTGAEPAPTPGIHHISAICGDPQRNLDFYSGLLGLRLVKRTVNFDDPGTYHLYYGDALGTPGTILTFFAWVLPPGARAQARQGTGQLSAARFRVRDESLGYWVDRLAAAGIDFDGPETIFDEAFLALRDPDGLTIELVARRGSWPSTAWKQGPVPAEHAIGGFAGATLCLDGYERTADLLTRTMGLREVGREGARFRFSAGEGESAAAIDLDCRPEGDPGRMGIGAVHHLAWRAPSGGAQRVWRRVLADAGMDVTPILDRKYFESIYYREPGGILFEIATDPPGFTVDEALEDLGTRLQLPDWLEPRRQRLEARLPPLRAPSWRGGAQG